MDAQLLDECMKMEKELSEARNALRTIASWPLQKPDQIDDAWNIVELAKRALA